jgi:hypothetical protein
MNFNAPKWMVSITLLLSILNLGFAYFFGIDTFHTPTQFGVAISVMGVLSSFLYFKQHPLASKLIAFWIIFQILYVDRLRINPDFVVNIDSFPTILYDAHQIVGYQLEKQIHTQYAEYTIAVNLFPLFLMTFWWYTHIQDLNTSKSK